MATDQADSDTRSFMDDTPLRGTVLAATVLAIPLAVLGPALPGIEFPALNVFAYRLYVPVYAAVLVLAVLTADRPALSLPRNALYVLVVAMYAAASVLWAPDRAAALRELALLSSGLTLAVLLPLVVQRRSDLRHLVMAVTGLALLALPIAAVELLTDWHHPLSQLTVIRDAPPYDRFSSAWFRNVNDFSLFLGLAAPFFLVNALDDRQPTTKRVLHGVVVAAIAGVVTLNSARAAMAMLVVVVLAGVVLARRPSLASRAVDSRHGGTAIATVALVGGALAFTFASVVIANPFAETQFSLWVRWQLLSAGARMLFDTLVGVGVGNYPVVLDTMAVPTDGITSPHNWVVRALAEFGFIGGGLLLFAVARVIDGLLVRYAATHDLLDLALLLSVVGFVIGGMGASSALALEAVWVVLGLGIAAISIRR